MTDATKPPTDEVTDLVEAPPETRAEAQERARKCAVELDEVLARYKCCIMPRLDMANIEPVGVAGDKLQLAATYWIAPLAP